jgi:hypothetical protein
VCSRAAWHLHIPHSHYAAAPNWGITLHFGFRAVLMEIQLTSPAQHLRSDLGYTSSIGVGLLLWIISDVCWPHMYRINAIVSSVFHVSVWTWLWTIWKYTQSSSNPHISSLRVYLNHPVVCIACANCAMCTVLSFIFHPVFKSVN